MCKIEMEVSELLIHEDILTQNRITPENLDENGSCLHALIFQKLFSQSFAQPTLTCRPSFILLKRIETLAQ